jgi:hypothetical protein
MLHAQENDMWVHGDAHFPEEVNSCQNYDLEIEFSTVPGEPWCFEVIVVLTQLGILALLAPVDVHALVHVVFLVFHPWVVYFDILELHFPEDDQFLDKGLVQEGFEVNNVVASEVFVLEHVETVEVVHFIHFFHVGPDESTPSRFAFHVLELFIEL